MTFALILSLVILGVIVETIIAVRRMNDRVNLMRMKRKADAKHHGQTTNQTEQ